MAYQAVVHAASVTNRHEIADKAKRSVLPIRAVAVDGWGHPTVWLGFAIMGDHLSLRRLQHENISSGRKHMPLVVNAHNPPLKVRIISSRTQHPQD